MFKFWFEKKHTLMKLIWTAGISADVIIAVVIAIANFYSKKFFRASTGFEPMASSLAMQFSTNWAMQPQMLGTDQFSSSSLTVKGMRREMTFPTHGSA